MSIIEQVFEGLAKSARKHGHKLISASASEGTIGREHLFELLDLVETSEFITSQKSLRSSMNKTKVGWPLLDEYGLERTSHHTIWNAIFVMTSATLRYLRHQLVTLNLPVKYPTRTNNN